MPSSYGSNCEDSCVVSCPSGWEREGDRCFFWSNEVKTWFEAEETCQKRYGGHLASVTSQSVHEYMVSKKKQVWIGGTDIHSEWVWSDCSVWNFFSGWKSGEPSGTHPIYGHTENCMEYLATLELIGLHYNYAWNDKQCYHEQEFVCSKTICAGGN